MSQPNQPILKDAFDVDRYQHNTAVKAVFDKAGITFDQLADLGHSKSDIRQLMQLLGHTKANVRSAFSLPPRPGTIPHGSLSADGEHVFFHTAVGVKENGKDEYVSVPIILKAKADYDYESRTRHHGVLCDYYRGKGTLNSCHVRDSDYWVSNAVDYERLDFKDALILEMI